MNTNLSLSSQDLNHNPLQISNESITMISSESSKIVESTEPVNVNTSAPETAKKIDQLSTDIILKNTSTITPPQTTGNNNEVNFDETINILIGTIVRGEYSELYGILNQLSDQDKQKIIFLPTPFTGHSLLSIAAYIGNIKIVELFIESFHDNKDLLCKELRKGLVEGVTPLFVAAQLGHLEIAKKLLACFDDKMEQLSYQRQQSQIYQQTPLLIASSHPNGSDIVEYFLDQLEPEQVYEQLIQEDERGNTPLVLAAGNNCLKTIPILLNKLSVSQRISYLLHPCTEGLNPLLAAILGEKKESIELLINLFFECGNSSKSAYICANDVDGNNALHYAAKKDSALLKYIFNLLDDTPEFIQSLQAKNRFSETPLKYAMRLDKHDGVMTILDKMWELKLDMGEGDLFNNTALHYASEIGNLEVFTWYLENAPQVLQQKNIYGLTPIDLCLMHRQTVLLELLKSKNLINTSSMDHVETHPLYGSPLPLINQSVIIKKFIMYLKKQNRLDEEILSSGQRDQLPPCFKWDSKENKWKIRGLCQGLTPGAFHQKNLIEFRLKIS